MGLQTRRETAAMQGHFVKQLEGRLISHDLNRKKKPTD